MRSWGQCTLFLGDKINNERCAKLTRKVFSWDADDSKWSFFNAGFHRKKYFGIFRSGNFRIYQIIEIAVDY